MYVRHRAERRHSNARSDSNMKMRFSVLATLAALSLTGPALAQAPRGAAVTTLGTQKVTIDYGRPALKGRTIDALLKQLPPDRIWRAGENEITTFSTEADVKIGGKAVKAGKYSLYVHVPVSGKWALVLNSDLGQPLGSIWKEAPENLKNMPYPYLDGYEQKVKAKEVLRADLKPGKSAPPAENFTVSFTPKGSGSRTATPSPCVILRRIRNRDGRRPSSRGAPIGSAPRDPQSQRRPDCGFLVARRDEAPRNDRPARRPVAGPAYRNPGAGS
jgi:hypothetical protein